MTGRYRLLVADFKAVKAAGSKLGDRDSMQAQRLGLPFDSWPPLDFAMEKVESAAWAETVDFRALGSDDQARLLNEWITGYRDGYAEAWEFEDA